MRTTTTNPKTLLLMTLLSLVLSSTASGEEKAPLGIAIELFDPSGKAMNSFHEALRATQAGEGQTKMMFFGASHVASDTYTGRLRRLLQNQFGDAGHGFVLPAKPWRYYRHRDVVIDGTLTWWADWVGKTKGRLDGFFGLGGVSISTNSKDDYGSLATTVDNPQGRAVSRFEVYYLAQPGGGAFDLHLDGKLVRRVETDSLVHQAGYEAIHTVDGGHKLEIFPVGNGEVRLFGVTMDRDTPGVRLDALGVNGTRASTHLSWNDEMYAEHISKRDPHLLVLAYGTNESGDTDHPIEDYAANFKKVVARARAAAPNASCLLIGPSDWPIKQGRKYVPRPRTAELITIQQETAREQGCAFFDMVEFMGGPMSMREWVRAKPPFASKDHIHFTGRGYDRMADVLHEALLRGFEESPSP